MTRSSVEVDELVKLTSAVLGSTGLKGSVGQGYRAYIGDLITTKEAAKTFIEREGFGFIPQTRVGTNAPIQTERVRKRTLTPKRYAASIVIDETFLENDPIGYANNLGNLLKRAAGVTMQYLAELHILKFWSSELSIVDGLSILNANHVIADGTQANYTASAFSATTLMSMLDLLGIQYNTEGAPVLPTESQKCNLLVSGAKYMETVSIVKSGMIPGSANNDDFEFVGAHVDKVIPMRFWPLVASTSTKWALIPSNKSDVQTAAVQTKALDTTIIPKNRRGLRYEMVEFEMDFITKTHYGIAGGG